MVRWRALSLAGGIEYGGAAAVMGALALITFALALTSVAGLWRARWWGVAAFYPFAALFTLVFGASLIPFVVLALPVEARVVGVFVINAIVLVLGALVHWTHAGSGNE